MKKKVVLKYLLEKLTAKRGFFMPSVMLYVLILISFSLWLTVDTLSYIKLVEDYETSTLKEAAIEKVKHIITENSNLNKSNECTITTFPVLDRNTSEYKISIEGYCLREPQSKYIGYPPGVDIARIAYSSLLLYDEEIDDETYKILESDVIAAVATQTLYNFVGPGIGLKDVEEAAVSDGVSMVFDAAEYALITSMPRRFIYNVNIKINDIEYYYMIIYDQEDQEVIKIISA